MNEGRNWKQEASLRGVLPSSNAYNPTAVPRKVALRPLKKSCRKEAGREEGGRAITISNQQVEQEHEQVSSCSPPPELIASLK